MPKPRLAIFLRYPTPGETKTRLIPALGPEGAARLSRKLAEPTLAAARASGLDFELRVTGADPARFREWLGNDLAIMEQGGGDLGARLARVPAPAILIGSDAPGVTGPLLARAAECLGKSSIVIGPANDGGYYLIGFTRPAEFLFTRIEWSTPRVLPETLRRLDERGITPALLPELTDIDLPEDLALWPEFAAGAADA